MRRIFRVIVVGRHDRTRAVSYITESGVVRVKSRTRQTLRDAWESTVWEDLFDNPLHMLITETRLTKKVIADEEGTDLLLPKIAVEKKPEIERRRFFFHVGRFAMLFMFLDPRNLKRP